MNDRKSLYLHIVLTALLWLTGIAASFSQDHIFDTEIINVEDGLPHRRTFDIVQDKEGFIWMSNPGSISRYDGYHFRTYYHDFLSIPEGSPPTLAFDRANLLWYNASQAHILDIQKDTIYALETFSKGLFNLRDVAFLGQANTENDILIATKQGSIYKYTESFEEIYRFPRPFSTRVYCKEAPDGSLWVSHGHMLFNIRNQTILNTFQLPEHIQQIIFSPPRTIIKIAYDHPIPFWELKNEVLRPFSVATHPAEEIGGVFQLHPDYTCFADSSQLIIVDKKENIIYNYDQIPLSGTSKRQMLKNNTTFTDRQNNMWIGTEDGVIKVSVAKNPFEHFQSGNSIRGIYYDKGRLWTGGYFRNEVEEQATKIRKMFLAYPQTAMSFFRDEKKHLWIGTAKNQMIEYHPEKDEYTIHEFSHPGGPALTMYLPFQNTLTKNYWAGTENGVLQLNMKNKTVTPLELSVSSKGLNVRQFYQDKESVWIVTNRGLYQVDGKTEEIVNVYTRKNGLPTDNLNYVYKDEEGIFWIGTRGRGLVRWDRGKNTFRNYTQENGLSNNNIYAVYEDGFERLWLPSDYGLMSFDKRTATARVYLPQHGIAHEEFNTYAHFMAKDSSLYFGGLNGVTKFHPKDLENTLDMSIPLYATRIQVLEQGLEEFREQTTDYQRRGKVALNPEDKILEITLTLLDYDDTFEKQYAYRLSEHQDQWVYTNENKFSIINPPYGNYNLEVIGRGSSGQWSDRKLIIPMHVKMPFYMQLWFILGIALFVIAAIIIGVRWRIRKLEKDRSRLEHEVQKRTRKIEADKKIIEKDKQVIEQQAEALQALDKAKTRFFANITHEFRTPLTLVTGPLEQMMEKLPPPKAIRSNISAVLKNARNLMSLINQLLDLSKLEGGRMKIAVSHGDIIRYTKELVHRFQALANTKQVDLEFIPLIVKWEIHFDSDKWTKILYNLLSNAIKFTPEGGKVIVNLQQQDRKGQTQIQLKVKDTGIGIAPENLEHIFNRFYQADTSATRLQGGTGIGLSLVKELVELQNGTVTVSSVPDKGAEFTVTLPVTPANQLASPLSIPEALLSVTTDESWHENGQTVIKDTQEKAQHKKLELLIIEDHAEMRAYIRSCIDASVYNISEASNGEEGIEKAQEFVPDLIISDVMMPKKNGFEVTHAIRNHIATSHIPLILLTAKASLESRLEGLERGADAYLTKPFSPQELALRIKKLIELRRMLQQRYQNGDKPPEENAAFQKEDGFISELKTYILEHSSEPDLGVETISRHFAMSRRQLYRKLKALTNTPVAHYIRDVRLEKAMELLKEKQLNITEVAYETGFSPGNFAKIFKKAYGRVPSEL